MTDNSEQIRHISERSAKQIVDIFIEASEEFENGQDRFAATVAAIGIVIPTFAFIVSEQVGEEPDVVMDGIWELLIQHTKAHYITLMQARERDRKATRQ
jgi:hypothetical protein